VQIRNRGTIGGNIINASPAADTLPALYVYEGRCELRTSTSRRIVPIEKLLSGPGKTKLRRGELLVAIRIPLKLGPHRFDYQRLAPRRAVAIAKVSVAVVSVQQKGHIKDIRIAFGAVAPTVVRAREIEKQITTDSWPLEDELLRKLVQHCVRPIDDIRSTAEYRQKMCTVLLKRALSQVLQA
jgi:CO/xanthine dehydrogenase FAD-binding subunit